jgi:hypothetical protein
MSIAGFTRSAAFVTGILALVQVNELSAQLARRSTVTVNAVRVLAASSGARSLSSDQKLTLIREVAGAVDAAALANPVLLTAKQPNYADQIYVNTQNTTDYSYPSQEVRWNLWPGHNAGIFVVVVRAVMTKPVLVDCVVSGSGTTGEAQLTVTKGGGNSISEVAIKGMNQHLATVLLPTDAGAHAATVGIQVKDKSYHSADVRSCEVTAMK